LAEGCTTSHVVDASDALAEAAMVGAYFQVDRRQGAEGWRRLADLTGDPELLDELVDSARAVLASVARTTVPRIERRAAASTVFLGLATRIMAPATAAAVLAGVVPRFTLEGLWWLPVTSGPLPLAVANLPGYRVDDLGSGEALEPAAERLYGVVSEVVAPLLEVFGERYHISEQVLWGNVASGLGGSLTMLAACRGDLAATAAGLTRQLLQKGRLAGTGELVRPDPAYERWFFVRRSCCLYYRVPGAGTCGDCVLTPEDVRRRQWQSMLGRRP
jgi:hypothetical protein